MVLGQQESGADLFLVEFRGVGSKNSKAWLGTAVKYVAVICVRRYGNWGGIVHSVLHREVRQDSVRLGLYNTSKFMGAFASGQISWQQSTPIERAAFDTRRGGG
jgi:hypothetical protein